MKHIHFTTMQTLKIVATALLVAVLLDSCRFNNPFGSNYLGSVTTIPAGRTFELGGNGNGAFSAQVSNVGSKPVTVSQRQSDGQVTALGQLKPGDVEVLNFVAGSAAVFVNTSAQSSAELGLKVIGDKNLSMGYAKEK
jgi:hypothetical protein